MTTTIRFKAFFYLGSWRVFDLSKFLAYSVPQESWVAAHNLASGLNSIHGELP